MQQQFIITITAKLNNVIGKYRNCDSLSGRMLMKGGARSYLEKERMGKKERMRERRSQREGERQGKRVGDTEKVSHKN